MTSPQHVILVHGAWHGAWCFSALQQELDARGIPSYAIDLPGHGASLDPLGDLYADADAVRDFLVVLANRGITDPVLVGHSYGGAVISQAAAMSPGVSALVYMAAFALHAGESVMSALGAFPRHDVPLGSAIEFRDDGTSILSTDAARQALYGSCSEAIVDAAVSRLTPQPMVTLSQELTASALGHIPSTYVICSRDEAVHPVHQEIMAQRCTHAVTLDTDHSPFISKVSDTATIIELLARRT